jgi:hypothetical protein
MHETPEGDTQLPSVSLVENRKNAMDFLLQRTQADEPIATLRSSDVGIFFLYSLA